MSTADTFEEANAAKRREKPEGFVAAVLVSPVHWGA